MSIKQQSNQNTKDKQISSKTKRNQKRNKRRKRRHTKESIARRQQNRKQKILQAVEEDPSLMYSRYSHLHFYRDSHGVLQFESKQKIHDKQSDDQPSVTYLSSYSISTHTQHQHSPIEQKKLVNHTNAKSQNSSSSIINNTVKPSLNSSPSLSSASTGRQKLSHLDQTSTTNSSSSKANDSTDIYHDAKSQQSPSTDTKSPQVTHIGCNKRQSHHTNPSLDNTSSTISRTALISRQPDYASKSIPIPSQFKPCHTNSNESDLAAEYSRFITTTPGQCKDRHVFHQTPVNKQDARSFVSITPSIDTVNIHSHISSHHLSSSTSNLPQISHQSHNDNEHSSQYTPSSIRADQTKQIKAPEQVDIAGKEIHTLYERDIDKIDSTVTDCDANLTPAPSHLFKSSDTDSDESPLSAECSRFITTPGQCKTRNVSHQTSVNQYNHRSFGSIATPVNTAIIHSKISSHQSSSSPSNPPQISSQSHNDNEHSFQCTSSIVFITDDQTQENNDSQQVDIEMKEVHTSYERDIDQIDPISTFSANINDSNEVYNDAKSHQSSSTHTNSSQVSNSDIQQHQLFVDRPQNSLGQRQQQLDLEQVKVQMETVQTFCKKK